MCMAEKASRACMTYALVAPIFRILPRVLACKAIERLHRQDNTGHLRRDLTGPQGEAVGVDGIHLIADRSDVKD